MKISYTLNNGKHSTPELLLERKFNHADNIIPTVGMGIAFINPETNDPKVYIVESVSLLVYENTYQDAIQVFVKVPTNAVINQHKPAPYFTDELGII